MPSKKAAKKSSSTKSSTKAAAVTADAFTAFAMHRVDEADDAAFEALKNEHADFAGFALTADPVGSLDPETVARRYLEQVLASESVPGFTAPGGEAQTSEFKSLGTKTLPLTNSKTVKFRQFYNKIPVYSSLVTVELDEGNELLSINSNLGTPEGVSPLAKVSPADALKRALKAAGTKPSETLIPRLNYYHDQKKGRWRLAYIIEDVPVARKGAGAASASGGRRRFGPLLYADYVIDAHTGAVIAELPRTYTMADPDEEDALDDLGRTRRIRFTLEGDGKVLRDSRLSLLTHDFGFGDPGTDVGLLPGQSVTSPPLPWDSGAVSAHANAGIVATFLRQVLKCTNIDDLGGVIVSSVNCVVAEESPGGRQWPNAMWLAARNQMIYGQSLNDQRLVSYAARLDIVAHELFHGVTARTARLEYADQSGALSESYSDIFAILVSNMDEPDISAWDWQLGEGIGEGGHPIRDFSQPSRHDQPEHMSQFVIRPNTRNGDYGGVHTNSGIHNFAAFKIMTARDEQGGFLFTPAQLAAIFYHALTELLTRQSDFRASRRALMQAAKSCLLTEPPETRDPKVAAIAKAFNDVGIPGPEH